MGQGLIQDDEYEEWWLEDTHPSGVLPGEEIPNEKLYKGNLKTKELP